MTNPKRVDVDFVALFGRTGRGKTTLAIALGTQYSLSHSRALIASNIPLSIPGIPTSVVTHAKDLLAMCTDTPCSCKPKILLIDEFDKSFTSNIGWLNREREQKLTELVSNARKHNVIALIATSQGKKKIRNTFRLNCKYIIEPTGTLDSSNCPEYFIWNDVELYEESGKGRYQYAEFCSSLLPLVFLDSTFNTREIVPLEWD